MNLPIMQQAIKTMSSKDLLQLINQIRQNFGESPVRQNDFNNRIIDELDGQHYETFVVQNLNNTQSTHFNLTIEQCTLVGMRESKGVRRSVLEKLKQLEQPQIALPNFNDPVAAARAWADEVEAKQKLAITLEQAKPKINHYDKVVARNQNLLNATQVAQKLGKSAYWLNPHLELLKVYNSNVKRGRAFAQWFMDKGLGVMKQTDNGFSQPLFTLTGEAWIIQKLTEQGVA